MWGRDLVFKQFLVSDFLIQVFAQEVKFLRPLNAMVSVSSAYDRLVSIQSFEKPLETPTSRLFSSSSTSFAQRYLNFTLM